MRRFYLEYPDLLGTGFAARVANLNSSQAMPRLATHCVAYLPLNYYDREIVEKGDNPTIGLILCTDKNETVARYVLGEQTRQIFASRYKLHLPSEDELRDELAREIERLDRPIPEPNGPQDRSSMNRHVNAIAGRLSFAHRSASLSRSWIV